MATRWAHLEEYLDLDHNRNGWPRATCIVVSDFDGSVVLRVQAWTDTTPLVVVRRAALSRAAALGYTIRQPPGTK